MSYNFFAWTAKHKKIDSKLNNLLFLHEIIIPLIWELN